MVTAVGVPPSGSTGVLFQASNASGAQAAELAFSNNQPQARWADAAGHTVLITAPAPLTPNTANVVSMTSAAGAQQLRVNATAAGSGSGTFSASPFDQMLLGWGFTNFYPNPGFGGFIKAVVTGRGAITAQELTVLERYVGNLAGMAL